MLKTQQLSNAQDSAALSGIKGPLVIEGSRAQMCVVYTGSCNSCLTNLSGQLCKALGCCGKMMHAYQKPIVTVAVHAAQQAILAVHTRVGFGVLFPVMHTFEHVH